MLQLTIEEIKQLNRKQLNLTSPLMQANIDNSDNVCLNFIPEIEFQVKYEPNDILDLVKDEDFQLDNNYSSEEDKPLSFHKSDLDGMTSEDEMPLSLHKSDKEKKKKGKRGRKKKEEKLKEETRAEVRLK